jgi:hypothetical protein
MSEIIGIKGVNRKEFLKRENGDRECSHPVSGLPSPFSHILDASCR